MSEPSALIEIEGVVKHYGSVVALDGVSASISEQAVGLLGANGAGKSTLMRAMLGLIRPDRGRSGCWGSTPRRDPGTFAAGSATCRSTTRCRWA